jgi:hypothetical protein
MSDMFAPIQDTHRPLRWLLSPTANQEQIPSQSRFGSFLNAQNSVAYYEARPSELHGWLTGTFSTIMATDALLHWIERIYIVPDWKAVREFVREHQNLADILIDAYEPLVAAFGPFPQVSLSIVRDPEINGNVELLAAILTPLQADEALSRLEQFDARWFLNQFKQTNGYLVFDLEFV